MIFNLPVIANKIAITLWIEKFNEFVIDFKDTFDWFFLEIPTVEELEETYNWTIDWAIELKDNIVSWVNEVKDWLDSVRSTLDGAVDTYNEVKDTVSDTTETITDAVDAIKSTTDSIKDTADTITTISNTISWNNTTD